MNEDKDVVPGMKELAEICTSGITCIKNARNPFYNSNYADLQTVIEALREPLEKAKLGYLFDTSKLVNKFTGEIMGWEIAITVIFDGRDIAYASFPINANDPQQFGKAITYGKRYLLTTVFNVIAEEDDDGNEASGKNDAKPKLEKKSPKPLAPDILGL